MEKNKKKFSLFCSIIATCIIAISTIQKLIFWKANLKKIEQPLQKHIYPWKEGNVCYSVYGTGRPLLLLHNTEIGASSIEWQNNIKSLSRIYQVFVPDLPGFGESQKPKITYTAYQYALFINHFIEDVIQRPAFVIGSSASADFALMAYALKSKNIRKLVLISPTGLEKTLPTKKENYKRMILQCPILGTHFFILSASKKAIKKQLTQYFFFSKEMVTKELIDNYYTMAHKGKEHSRFSFASVHTNFTSVDIQKVLKDIKIPFCVIWGENNKKNIAQHLKEIEALRHDGTYYLFENTRMLPHYENSEVFNETVHSFLQ